MFREPFGVYGFKPVRNMERLQRELMKRLFSDSLNEWANRPSAAPSYPAINVWTNEDGAVVTAELPGMDVNDIEISVVGDTLTLKGERKAPALAEGERYHRQERGYGKFTRTFQLPFLVEGNKVEAVFQKGILQIQLPRAEAEKPRKIAVKAA